MDTFKMPVIIYLFYDALTNIEYNLCLLRETVSFVFQGLVVSQGEVERNTGCFWRERHLLYNHRSLEE